MDINTLKDLANSSFLASSYRDSYKYSSSVIEADPTESEAWLIKGLSAAAMMVDDDTIKVEEVIFSLDRGFKNHTPSFGIEKTQSLIENCYADIIKNLEASHKEKIIDHHKVPMPAGGSAVLHRVAQKGFARLSAKVFIPKRIAAIKLLEKSLSLNENEASLKSTIAAVDSFYSHSSEYMDYLKDEPEATSYLSQLRTSLISKANAAGIQVNTAPPAKSGCFIATAATGSYDHPKVLVLRSFRDEILQKHRLGQAFIAYYYRLSPSIASKIENSELRKKLVLGAFITPLAFIATWIVNATQTKKR
ncbi:hypothetical protein HND72_27460 [Pseudomonas putida]|uniref:CFI-box-CTERM domain-containing protein n=1 Tax=Pseudomonas putida TaxID=303 RepID=UPI000D3C251B|nr:CFI-box-CTERM domain-containing protein [Pseudomonas putida]MDO1498287.1 hypothetical protein [Pseudomonas putida]PTV66488.1 hypothetical protein DBL03_01890 [Pseudomonas putida]